MTEYEESTKEFKNGTIIGARTTRRPVKSNSKDSNDKLPKAKPKLSKFESKTVAAAGPPGSVERHVKFSTLRFPEEEHEDAQE